MSLPQTTMNLTPDDRATIDEIWKNISENGATLTGAAALYAAGRERQRELDHEICTPVIAWLNKLVKKRTLDQKVRNEARVHAAMLAVIRSAKWQPEKQKSGRLRRSKEASKRSRKANRARRREDRTSDRVRRLHEHRR